MKLPSVEKIVNEVIVVLKRFPLPILAAILATFSMIMAAELEFKSSNETVQILLKLAQTFALGIGLYAAIRLYGEKHTNDETMRWVLPVVGTVFLALYFFMLPAEMGLKDVYRMLVVAMVLHLAVSFSLHFGSSNHLGFWNFNKTLFLRIILSGIYSMFIYGGIVIAMVAVTELFDFSINEKRYFELFLIVVGVFNTIHFLAGMPQDWDEIDTEDDYPMGLKIFTQFVLLPLVSIYLLILYGYLIKILINWEIPQGILPYLVLIFSGLGIFALLLIYPLSEQEKYAWIKKFSYIFYLSLFPLIILLFVAVFMRIGDYGVTENRYFIVILALWLAGISIYLLINKIRNIKMIPISLAIIGIISVYGPVSSFSVSERSQFNRLKELVEENNILKGGVVIDSTQTIDFEVRTQITDITSYLIETHGYKALQPLFKQNLDSLFDSISWYTTTQNILNLMHVPHTTQYSDRTSYVSSSFTCENPTTNVLDIQNFDFIFEQYVNYGDSLARTDQRILNTDTLQINYSTFNTQVAFVLRGEPLVVKLDSIVDVLLNKMGGNSYDVKQDSMIFDIENQTLRMKLHFLSISTRNPENESLQIETANFRAYIAVKKE